MSKTALITAGIAILFTTTSVYSQMSDDPPARHVGSAVRGERQMIRPDVIALYNAIAPLPTLEQKRVLVGAAPEVKSALWTYNMYIFLDNYPDLTPPQRAAVHKNLAYISNPKVFAPFTDPAEAKLDELTMDDIAETIDAAGFSPELATTAFIHLGPIAIRDHPLEDSNTTSALQLQPQPKTYPDCMCRSNVGCWEYYVTYCDWSYYYCQPNNSCGYDGKMSCIGVCTNGSV